MFKSQKEIYDKLNEKISPLSSEKIIFYQENQGLANLLLLTL